MIQEHNIDIDYSDENYDSLLEVAVTCNNKPMIEKLISMGADIHYVAYDRILRAAINSGNIDTVTKFLSNKVTLTLSVRWMVQLSKPLRHMFRYPIEDKETDGRIKIMTALLQQALPSQTNESVVMHR